MRIGDEPVAVNGDERCGAVVGDDFLCLFAIADNCLKSHWDWTKIPDGIFSSGPGRCGK